MGIPLFTDLGKEAYELLTKNFFVDCVKVEMKSEMVGNMSVLGNQQYNIEDGKMAGELGAKFESSGVTITHKINTESAAISFDCKVDRPELKGINVVGSGTFNPKDGKNITAFGVSYHGSGYNIEVAHLQNDPLYPQAQGNMIRAQGVFT